jgi:hypothetical protein
VEPEHPLTAVVINSAHQERLLAIQAPADLDSGLYAFERFPQLNEEALQGWIARLVSAYRVGELSARQSERLGALVLRKKWVGAAHALRAAMSRRDFAPALRECISLFGFVDRFSIRLVLGGKEKSARDLEEFWEELEAELSSVYPHGPTDQKVWSRAGGDESKLDTHGNGRRQWIAAIHVLQRGGGGKHFGIRKLLSTACSDFHRNQRLSLLDRYAREHDL